MYSLTINGKEVSCKTNKKLMDFVRDDLRLTGTKDGCNQGSCGACSVLVNGRTTKACLMTLEKLAGKEVITVEGLSDYQKMYTLTLLLKQGQCNVDFVFLVF